MTLNKRHWTPAALLVSRPQHGTPTLSATGLSRPALGLAHVPMILSKTLPLCKLAHGLSLPLHPHISQSGKGLAGPHSLREAEAQGQRKSDQPTSHKQSLAFNYAWQL